MDSTVIQPSPGQAILTTSDDHGDHGRHGDYDFGYGGRGFRDDLDRTILSEQAAFARTDAAAHTDTIGAIKDTRFDLAQNQSRDAAFAAAASAKTDSLVAFTSNLTQSKICELAKDQISGFKDAQAVAYQIEGRALLEAVKNAAASQLQAQVNASASALQAQVNASVAAAQLAACCCELKERITADGLTTRSLIEANEKDRLREKNAECERKLAAYYSRNAPPVIPS